MKKRVFLPAVIMTLITVCCNHVMAQTTVGQLFEKFSSARDVLDFTMDGMGEMYAGVTDDMIDSLITPAFVASALNDDVKKSRPGMGQEEREKAAEFSAAMMKMLLRTRTFHFLSVEKCCDDVRYSFRKAVSEVDFSEYEALHVDYEGKSVFAYVMTNGDLLTEIVALDGSPGHEQAVMLLEGNYPRETISNVVVTTLEVVKASRDKK